MNEHFFSLLYPTEQSRLYHENPMNLPNISSEVCAELGLYEIFGLKSCRLFDFFTEDEEVIRYREETFADLCAEEGLRSTLSEVYPILSDIHELHTLSEANTPADSYLYSITEIELYISAVELLAKGLAPYRDKMKSRALRGLFRFVTELSESDYYIELNQKLSALADRVHEVKSLTIGVNLDRTMRPESAGVISVNADKFKSGRVLDKILRFSFKNDAFTCISELSPVREGQSENQSDAMVAAFHEALNNVFRSSIRGWRSIVGEYVLDSADRLLRMLPEIEFVCRGAEVCTRLAAHEGCAMTYPTILPKEAKAFSAIGLFNPRVALAIEEPIVDNDLVLDEQAGIYILTGPNRGGKSVITVAMGAAQAMFQLGMPVPAKEAALSVTDGIFTHFPEGADDTIDKGRLGEECARLREIFDDVTGHSLILLDESLSSTGAYEAAYIAEEILTAFAAVGCRGIFSTHLHELALAKERINARIGAEGARIDTLVAGMEEGQRSFKIVRRAPDGKSYARDIADKYGLSFEALMADAKNKKSI